jgi:hypothetical protein
MMVVGGAQGKMLRMLVGALGGWGLTGLQGRVGIYWRDRIDERTFLRLK